MSPSVENNTHARGVDGAGARAGSSLRKRGWVLALVGLILLTIASFGRLTLAPRFYADEVEHAHVTWALGEGLLPYRDIHQIHMPLVWILNAPLLSLLPEAAGSLLALRLVCVLALAGTILAAQLALNELVSRPTIHYRLFVVLIAVSVTGQLQFDRYRPDPFMALCTAWAIVAMLRMRRSPARHAFLSGAALGCAAGFSTKMVPLCAMIPLMALLEAIRTRTVKPLWIGLPNLAGFLAAALPLLGGLKLAGLFDDFVDWTIVHNSHMVDFSPWQVRMFFVPGWDFATFALLVLAGAFALATLGPGGAGGAVAKGGSGDVRDVTAERRSFSPVAAILIAAALAWSIRVIEPNRYAYNLQAMVMPGSVLGGFALEWLRTRRWRGVEIAALAAVLALLLWRPIVIEGHRAQVRGRFITAEGIDAMLSVTQPTDSTCVGFAPFHPVFCRDATDLYLGWDLAFIMSLRIKEEGKRPYREMWPRAIEQIRARRPALVVDSGFWKSAHMRGILTDAEYDAFTALIESQYEPKKLAGYAAWVRRAD